MGTLNQVLYQCDRQVCFQAVSIIDCDNDR
jgi:hypothetical protein